MTSTQRIGFGGRILLLGCGSVSQCLQPLLLRHIDMSFDKLTVIDFEDLRDRIPETLAAGAHYVRHRITPDNLASTLGEYLATGDMLINLSWNIGAEDVISWCHDRGVLYLDTSVEQWDPYADMGSRHPTERTLYARHLALRQMAARWPDRGPTAIVEHGANPGLVSHWTKVALEDLATAMLTSPGGLLRPLSGGQLARLEQALHKADYARLAMETGTKTIHISERDTQIGDRPKEVGEFVNTWSVEGFFEEGVAPAELGWGTHEKDLPPKAVVHDNGPGNQICLAQPGMTTWVRSWVPSSGPILGLLIRHGEAFTISDHLTVQQDAVVRYRPTVHYAYLPTDAAIASVHECWMSGFRLQQRQRIMTDEIVSGMDELGVLLLGHALNGWWTGSQLTIEETRSLVPHQNATTLQVAASALAAVFYLVRHPRQGLCVPDDLDHREVLAVASPYLGPTPSIPTDWTPTQVGPGPFDEFLGHRRSADVWQFSKHLGGMNNSSARLLLLLAAIGWGSATAATKYALSGFGPLTLLLIELTAATVVLWSVLVVRGIPRIERKGRFAVLGLFEPTLAYGGLALGLTYTTATNAALLGASEACFVVALAAIFLRERIHARSLAGLLLTFVGVLLIEQVFTISSDLNVGDFLVLGGDLAAAIYVILAVKVAATTGSLPMTAYQFGFGALLSLPFAMWGWCSGQEPFPADVDPHMWLVAVLIGGIGFVGSYLLYNHVINFVPAGLAGVTLNLIPLFGVLTAVIFLGEHPTVWHVVGGIAVIGGIMLFPTGKHPDARESAARNLQDQQLNIR